MTHAQQSSSDVRSSRKTSRLLIFVSEDWYFVSHRLHIALAARNAGYDVTILTRVREHGAIIRAAGLRLLPFELSRSNIGPIAELRTLARLVRVYRHERPDVVHHVAMKPVLYGAIAARLAGTSHVINALAGMGWLFTSSAGLARMLRPVVREVLARLLRRGLALVQNDDDAALLQRIGVPVSRIRQIPGSGVDLQRFAPTPEPASVVTVVLAARLLWDKGVGVYVAAARILRARGVEARFLLAGEPDPSNPSSVARVQVQDWVAEGIVTCIGWVSDMPRLLADAHIVCLPSYREGAPKSLLEAAAAGRPIVTTDVPGCRQVVEHGENGLLVPPRDAHALADALGRLINDPQMRIRMGAAGRRRAELEFGTDSVARQTLALYGEITGSV